MDHDAIGHAAEDGKRQDRGGDLTRPPVAETDQLREPPEQGRQRNHDGEEGRRLGQPDLAAEVTGGRGRDSSLLLDAPSPHPRADGASEAMDAPVSRGAQRQGTSGLFPIDVQGPVELNSKVVAFNLLSSTVVSVNERTVIEEPVTWLSSRLLPTELTVPVCVMKPAAALRCDATMVLPPPFGMLISPRVSSFE